MPPCSARVATRHGGYLRYRVFALKYSSFWIAVRKGVL